LLKSKRPVFHFSREKQFGILASEECGGSEIKITQVCKLSQGLLGKENSYLLGTLLVSKFQQIAMSRQAQQAALRRDFWLYIDEFAYFITPSMAEILTGARKYRVGLVLAHQELRQLQKDLEVAGAVMSNPYTRIVFRVGDDDARKLASGFTYFEAPDLQNLETGKAVARVERSDFDFNLTVRPPKDPPESEAAVRRKAVTAASRTKYARPRAEVEAELYSDVAADEQKPPPRPEEPKAPPTREPNTEKAGAPPPRPEPPPTPKPAPERPAARPSSADEMGRGGAQHRAVQQRIKKEAEELGFRSVIEKEILEGQGSVDLYLERGDQQFACEILFSTTVDHEIGNILKCLRAGFKNVVVICVDEHRLTKIAAAVAGSLGEQAVPLVNYFQPDPFIAHPKALAGPHVETPSRPDKRRGYTVKRSRPNLSPEEEKRREEAAIRSIAEAMRRKGK